MSCSKILGTCTFSYGNWISFATLVDRDLLPLYSAVHQTTAKKLSLDGLWAVFPWRDEAGVWLGGSFGETRRFFFEGGEGGEKQNVIPSDEIKQREIQTRNRNLESTWSCHVDLSVQNKFICLWPCRSWHGYYFSSRAWANSYLSIYSSWVFWGNRTRGRGLYGHKMRMRLSFRFDRSKLFFL